MFAVAMPMYSVNYLHTFCEEEHKLLLKKIYAKYVPISRIIKFGSNLSNHLEIWISRTLNHILFLHLMTVDKLT